MTEPTCQICHKNAPADGFQVCDTCKGFDPLAARIELDPTAKPIGHCMTCGADGWEPYKIGKATITAGICYSCVMRKKYGLDWVPGGNVEKRRKSAAKYREKKKAMKQVAGKIMEESREMIEAEKMSDWDEGGCKLAEPAPPTKVFKYPPPAEWVVRLAFYGQDEAMYRKIQAIATKERRTLEQQVLYLLYGVLGRTVV